jgi:hypothetical protein
VPAAGAAAASCAIASSRIWRLKILPDGVRGSGPGERTM